MTKQVIGPTHKVCPSCEGKGYFVAKGRKRKCPTCKGEGVVLR